MNLITIALVFGLGGFWIGAANHNNELVKGWVSDVSVIVCIWLFIMGFITVVF